MDIVSTLVPLVLGAVGGNAGGALLKQFSLGTVGNSIAGIVGGGIGNQVLGMLGTGGDGIVGQVAGGGVGGIVLMVVVGLIKNAMNKS
jgi:uncharacterized membrane protein YeaQ/YmgE (transglycosylase-associated protein family)